jgi:predicted membrane protein
MNKQNFVLQAILSVALTVGSGALLVWTLNTFSATAGALGIGALALVAVFLFMIGAYWLGRIISHIAGYGSRFYNHTHQGVVFALIIIAAGALLLAFNTKTLPVAWKGFFFSWPMLLILFGANELCKFHFLPGIILVGIGKFFLFDRLAAIYPQTAIYEQFTATYWPVLIIVVGLLLFLQFLIRPKKFPHHHSHFHHFSSFGKHGQCNHWQDIQPKDINNEGMIDYSCVFSGTEQVFLEPEFKGGRIETVFGGVNLDLRQTTLPEGETMLEIHSVFGGVELVMPFDWYVEVLPRSIFGGVTDKRPKRDAPDKSRKLIIIANSFFGGVVLK